MYCLETISPFQLLYYIALCVLHFDLVFFVIPFLMLASTPVVRAQVAVNNLKQCVTDIQRWCASRRLQLNPAKMELIRFGSRTNLKTMATQNVSLCMDSSTIQHVDAVRDLGVTFDSELTMQRHVNTGTRACFHHIRRLKQIR